MTGKRFLGALCVVFCLILTGCGGDKAEVRPFEAADVDTILASSVFTDDLQQVDAELVYGLYGLSADAVTDCTAYMSTGASAEEIVLFTAADESGVEAIQSACDWRVEDQTFGYKDYKPTEVPKLENAIVEVRGNTVLFVVANDWEGAAEAITGLE